MENDAVCTSRIKLTPVDHSTADPQSKEQVMMRETCDVRHSESGHGLKRTSKTQDYD